MNRVYNERYGNVIVWFKDGLVVKVIKPLNGSEATIYCKPQNLIFRDRVPDLEELVYHRCGDEGNNTYLPAIECVDGYKGWYINGFLHRDGGLPAIERVNGDREWWVGGERHRDGDSANEGSFMGTEPRGKLPAVEYANGDKYWYVNGKRHRDNDLPAVEHVNGDKEWYVNGSLHRDGGLPAVECAKKYNEW